MAWKGIKNAKILRTEADVLSHSYGAEAAPDTQVAPKPPAKSGIKDLVAELEESHKKDELIALADSLGLDSAGTKAEIARRIAEHQLSS